MWVLHRIKFRLSGFTYRAILLVLTSVSLSGKWGFSSLSLEREAVRVRDEVRKAANVLATFHRTA